MIKSISHKDGKVIYCTHTHHLLDPKYIPPKTIFLVSKDKNKSVSIERISAIKTIRRKENKLQPVYEALGIADWDFFTQTQKIILVEGTYDKYALEFICAEKLKDCVILGGVNAESILYYIPKLIAYGKQYVALWDNDEEGLGYQKKAVKSFGSREAHKMLLLPNKVDKNKFRMEEMFGKKDIKALATAIGLPDNASYNNVLLGVAGISDTERKKYIECLSPETIANFATLVELIKKFLLK